MMSLSEFHFIRPYWLLVIIPWLVIVAMSLKNRLGSGYWSDVCDSELLPYILQARNTGRHYGYLSSLALATLLAIFALAGPTWSRLPAPVFRNVSALVIVLDLSLSMDAGDVKPSRLIRAKYKIADILKRRKDGQTALVVYAGDAFTVTPLTDDTETISSQLSALTTGLMPVQGSNTVLALEKAVDLLKQAGVMKGNILLVTDGVHLDKTLPEVDRLDNYRLSVLAVGTTEGAPVKIPGGGFLKDRQGNIVIARLNPDDLRQLARAGGGLMQRLTDNDRDIDSLLADIDVQVQTRAQEEQDERFLELWDDKGPWLLIMILPLVVLSFRRGIL